VSFARVVQTIAALAGAAAVVLGAFGAHALRDSLDEHALAIWHTAVEYQFWHVLVLLVVAAMASRRATASLRTAAIAFIVGIVLFSGSLYALALGGPHKLGVITPIGGVALIVGWIALAIHAWKHGDR
jgi:uncharacterized membrane protein YgdD (TMEM256/DUF423 family)